MSAMDWSYKRKRAHPPLVDGKVLRCAVTEVVEEKNVSS